MRYRIFVEYSDGSESDWHYAFDLEALLLEVRKVLSGPLDVENITIDTFVN